MSDKKKYEGLYYSPKEGILFMVAGYTDNSSAVDEIIKLYKEHQKLLRDLIGEDVEVHTIFIDKSRRYRGMRVFYAKTWAVPDEAYVIGGPTGDARRQALKMYTPDQVEWTMRKWLED